MVQVVDSQGQSHRVLLEPCLESCLFRSHDVELPGDRAAVKEAVQSFRWMQSVT